MLENNCFPFSCTTIKLWVQLLIWYLNIVPLKLYVYSFTFYSFIAVLTSPVNTIINANANFLHRLFMFSCQIRCVFILWKGKTELSCMRVYYVIHKNGTVLLQVYMGCFERCVKCGWCYVCTVFYQQPIDTNTTGDACRAMPRAFWCFPTLTFIVFVFF